MMTRIVDQSILHVVSFASAGPLALLIDDREELEFRKDVSDAPELQMLGLIAIAQSLVQVVRFVRRYWCIVPSFAG